MAETIPEVNFFDPAVNDCPFPAFQRLRDDAPVWRDPVTNAYVLTRYEDIRAAILDPETFTHQVALSNAEGAMTEVDRELQKMYERDGWVPAPNLDAMDEPRHMQLRRLFDHAFRPLTISQLDPFVEELAYRLIDGFLADGRCEYIAQFAVPLPLYVIGRQVGVPEEDMPQIKAWTDAWVQRMGLTQTPEERVWSAQQEIDFQNYLQPIFERLRAEPDGTLLSELVNREIPDWGRPMNDNELHAAVVADMFVGGSETTTNALASGVRLLIEHPGVWERLVADPETHIAPFVEEVIRLEAPVQSLMRLTSVEVELHGVTIPAGSPVMLIYAAANRDERRFECPADIDLERSRPRSHLGFGTGTHHCLGAPLARREMYYGFKALVDRVESMWFLDGANDFSYQPNYFFRALKELHIGFQPRG